MDFVILSERGVRGAATVWYPPSAFAPGATADKKGGHYSSMVRLKADTTFTGSP